MRFEYDLTSQTNLFAGVSHSVRTADATERYMAAAGSAPWVGNPYLSPEKHRQIDAGIQYRSERWQAAASVFYDDVKDFIMRDTARSQDGILVTNSAATVYRNIDATLAGLETEASVSVSENLDLSAHATWTYGENDEDQDALAQIPPLEGAVSVTYQEDQWSVGSRLNFAFQQSRIDSDTSARDDDKTVGWATVDIFGKYDLSPLTLQVGAKNIFDQDYARHLSRTSAFDPTEVQVNEPGRSFYMELTARF